MKVLAKDVWHMPLWSVRTDQAELKDRDEDFTVSRHEPHYATGLGGHGRCHRSRQVVYAET